jgi:hypothetical protein
MMTKPEHDLARERLLHERDACLFVLQRAQLDQIVADRSAGQAQFAQARAQQIAAELNAMGEWKEPSQPEAPSADPRSRGAKSAKPNPARIIATIIIYCMFVFASFGANGGGDDSGAKPTPPKCSAFGWCKVGTVAGVVGNYTPVVQMGGSQIRVYANTNGLVDGDLWLRVGSWSSVGSATKVYTATDPSVAYNRTSGVAQGTGGAYYAVVYAGPCYGSGCVNGFSPQWLTSPDGYAWTTHGAISPFGLNQSSAMNLIVDESRTDAYRFMFWMDLYSPTNLVLVHSADGVTWQSDGLNVWPIAGETPQFVTAAKDQYGYHLIGANTFPATALRHVFSCTGLPPWHVLEMASPVINTSVGKGTNLVVDHPNNLLHALTSGVHWTLPIKPYPC